MPKIENRVLLTLPSDLKEWIDNNVEVLNATKETYHRKSKAQDLILACIRFSKRENIKFESNGFGRYVKVSRNI